ncbi:hypothetical protein MGU_08807 [Metarhizium guizhouense ARSEF 977]|uniref:Cell wall galactomannoprotein n=1 Tax=Metarhizium guizhouense (strain ARSEF 977) TaxID=1276136 RepID=A0A0B4GAT6_METGA|nr:hypothetical protein MGU_08807 [Metarhizium guizhouense ARSEF 977]
MKVLTALAIFLVDFSAASAVNSTPIEKTLQQLEQGKQILDLVLQYGFSPKQIADQAKAQVNDAVFAIRSAVEEAARAVHYANTSLGMDENDLEIARRNLGWAAEILESDRHQY